MDTTVSSPENSKTPLRTKIRKIAAYSFAGYVATALVVNGVRRFANSGTESAAA